MTAPRLSTKCVEWRASPTSRGSYFYPVTKYIGEVRNHDTGELIAATGKCAKPSTALRLADRKLFELLNNA